MGEKIKIRIRDEHSGRELRDNVLDFKLLKFFDTDPDQGSGIFLTLDPGWKSSYPGSGINIPDPQHFRFSDPETRLNSPSPFNVMALRLATEQGAMSLSCLGDLIGGLMTNGTALSAALLSAPILGLLIDHQLFVRRPESGHHWRAAGTGSPILGYEVLFLKKTFYNSVCTLHRILFHV